ncbi:MAG: hypothetical protein ACE5HU_10300, partial [Acidobacteriota bacterium]
MRNAIGKTFPVIGLLVMTWPAFAQPVLIHAGRLLDVSTGEVRAQVDILVKDGRIGEVGPHLRAPSGAAEIDLGDLTVLPGLIDSHTHICLRPVDAEVSPVLYKTDPY